jgi:flagellar hook-associated protein 2
MSINFNGLVSGLDTASMIDQLVAAEKSSATVLRQRVTDVNRQGTIIDDLTTRLLSVRDKARALDQASELRTAKATSSDDSHASVVVSGSAAAATHSLRVDTLARAQVTTSRTFASNGAGAAGTGSVDITTSAGTKSVSWTATDTLQDIADRINAADAASTASVVYDGTNYRLVATARQPGVANAPTYTDGGAGLGWSAPANVTIAASDARFTLDGIAMTRSTNLVADAASGMTLTLKRAHAVGETDTIVDVSSDGDAVKTKVKDVVDAFNTAANLVTSQLSYSGVTKGAGTLFGDSTLRQLQLAMNKAATDSHGGKTLAGLGITFDRTGRLSIDDAKLTAAIAADPRAAERLFVDGGLGTKLGDLADQYARSGDGILAAKGKSLDSQAASYQKQIDRIEDAATKVGERLRDQFTKLEKALSTMQQQSARLTAILG